MTDLKCSQDLLLAMDCLWFQQIVLSSEPKPTSTTTPQTTSQPPPQSIEEEDDDEEEEEEVPFLSEASSLPTQEYSFVDYAEADEDEDIDYGHMRNRHSSLNRVLSITWSPSSSPAAIRKTMSCKTLFELECEEVKGFMDLGFRFDKKNLPPRMMSMIPGLQRLDENKDGVEGNRIFSRMTDEEKDDVIEEMNENDQDRIRKPYLSEAWLIRKPDSPLINLRIPKVSTADDMKKHLKCWARTVATTIQLEC